MKPERLTQRDVLRRAREVGLKFRIERDGHRWVVLMTSEKVVDPIPVGQGDTYEQAKAFVDAKTRELEQMLPGIVKQVQDEEFPG